MSANKWIEGSSYDMAQKHTPVRINDFTSTKRFVCHECSTNMSSGLQFPDNGIDWPCQQAQALIDDSNWDAILLGIFDTI